MIGFAKFVELAMPVSAPAARVLRFDTFELDLRAGELRKRGVKLRLQGQPLQVLAILLQRAGDVVTRDELRAQIWTADTFVDFDHSLHNAVARIREVLGDSAETPRYIETLPRRGYRFIAQVEEVGIQNLHRPPQSNQASEAPVGARRSMPRAVLALTVLTFVTIGLALWLVPAFSHKTKAGLPLRSIAVLPLDNLSGDPSQDYFVDGMTDQLITDLAKVGALRVTSRTSVMRYKGTKKSLPEIARELNVDGIIEGSVMRSGQRVRITAQLLNAPLDQHLWAETYDRDLGDVLRLQSEVAQAIAQQVRAEVTPEQRARLRSARPVNPEAYEAYLKGRYYLSNQFTMVQPLNKAKSYFQDAIRKDPGFALAYNRAIELAPSYSCAHEDRTVFLSFMGRRAEALAGVEKSNKIDPGPSSAMTEAATYYQLRDYQALIEASRKGVASNPNEWTEHANLGAGYEGTGKLLEAISEYQKAVEMSDGDQDAAASLAHAYAMIGRRAEAKKILRDLEQKSNTAYVSPYIIAAIYAGLGEKDLAFEFLERAYRERSLEMSWHLKADLRIDSLRSEPRFQSLVRRVGLTD